MAVSPACLLGRCESCPGETFVRAPWAATDGGEWVPCECIRCQRAGRENHRQREPFWGVTDLVEP